MQDEGIRMPGEQGIGSEQVLSPSMARRIKVVFVTFADAIGWPADGSQISHFL